MLNTGLRPGDRCDEHPVRSLLDSLKAPPDAGIRPKDSRVMRRRLSPPRRTHPRARSRGAPGARAGGAIVLFPLLG